MNKTVVCLVLGALFALCVFVTAHQDRNNQTASNQKINENDSEPIVDYSTNETTDQLRQAKNRRHNNPNNPPIAELPAGGDMLPLNVHWWQGIPALPVSESAAIVLGEVTCRNAYLSEDKTSIYSEFTIQVEQVFKNDTESVITPGSQLIAERTGGAVRFASGKTQHYRLSNQGFPQTSAKYVLFLQHTDAAYVILTGYRLREEQVIPLDGFPGAKLPFEQFRGMPVSTFLRALEETVNSGAGLMIFS